MACGNTYEKEIIAKTPMGPQVIGIVRWWYDYSIRLWTVQALDNMEDQIQEAFYAVANDLEDRKIEAEARIKLNCPVF
jgi:hypothetical protein